MFLRKYFFEDFGVLSPFSDATLQDANKKKEWQDKIGLNWKITISAEITELLWFILTDFIPILPFIMIFFYWKKNNTPTHTWHTFVFVCLHSFWVFLKLVNSSLKRPKRVDVINMHHAGGGIRSVLLESFSSVLLGLSVSSFSSKCGTISLEYLCKDCANSIAFNSSTAALKSSGGRTTHDSQLRGKKKKKTKHKATR